MDFSTIPLFNIMRAKLDFMSQRQSVLAQNIANADLPGYRAKDVMEPNFKKMMGTTDNGARKLRMASTDPRHLGGASANIGVLQEVKRKSSYELNPDGNNVVIEEEMAKVAQNQADYQKVLNLYGKTVAMFKTALGVSGSGG